MSWILFRVEFSFRIDQSEFSSSIASSSWNGICNPFHGLSMSTHHSFSRWIKYILQSSKIDLHPRILQKQRKMFRKRKEKLCKNSNGNTLCAIEKWNKLCCSWKSRILKWLLTCCVLFEQFHVNQICGWTIFRECFVWNMLIVLVAKSTFDQARTRAFHWKFILSQSGRKIRFIQPKSLQFFFETAAQSFVTIRVGFGKFNKN